MTGRAQAFGFSIPFHVPDVVEELVAVSSVQQESEGLFDETHISDFAVLEFDFDGFMDVRCARGRF